MNSAVLVFACVLVAASAQFNNGQYSSGQYFPQQDQYYNKFNPYNRYNNNNNNNQYSQYNRYQQYNNAYRPYSSTPFPRPVVSVSSTPSPVFSTIAPSVVIAPIAPVAPVAPIAPIVPIVPVARVALDGRSAETVKYGNEINPDGSYNYFYETNGGIAAQEQGAPRNLGDSTANVAQGSFQWTSPEGQVVAISYIADENGYQPSGDAIPQPPEVPPQIARALEYIARYVPLAKTVAEKK